ncbi:MAG: PKD domain-containing protein [Bacteroidia bacterium]|nr:PKD domain-containing protein [Bacteroidia bacterium]
MKSKYTYLIFFFVTILVSSFLICCRKEKEESNNNQLNINNTVASFDSFFSIDSGSAIFVNTGLYTDSVIWKLWNGTTYYQPAIEVYFDSSGTYDITLIVKNNLGSDTIKKYFVIEFNSTEFMNGNVKINKGCGCGFIAANFKINNYLPSQGNYLYNWNFDEPYTGSANTSTLPTSFHTFNLPGFFVVNLLIKDNLGNTIINPKDTIKVLTNPEDNIWFSPYIASLMEPTIHFYSDTNNLIYNKWYFGDGVNSEEINPQHTYTSSGHFSVIHVMKSVNGCIDYSINGVLINP